jgi:6-phosphogluconolactonase
MKSMETSFEGRSPAKRRSRPALLLAVAAVAALVPAVFAVSGGEGKVRRAAVPVGAVYTETNDPGGNKLVVYDRFPVGLLSRRQALSTGGKGSTQSVGCGPGCPILDSQNAVVVSETGKLVFAVNAGSDTVTSFRKTTSGLKRVNQASSGGDMPESLAIGDDVLYVLNVNTNNSNGTTGSISALRIASSGHLTPIAGSSQPLHHFAPPDATARGIGIDPTGRFVVATELAANAGAGSINTFAVKPSGKIGKAVPSQTSDGFPFGFDFDPRGHLVVANLHSPTAGNGSVSSYRPDGSSGRYKPIATKSSQGVLPCWVVVTDDGRFAYVVNTGAGQPAPIAGFGLSRSGGLTFKGLTASRQGEFARTDAALSRGSRYLYVLSPSVGHGPPSHIDEYKVTANGRLLFLAKTPPGDNLGVGTTGLAAR